MRSMLLWVPTLFVGLGLLGSKALGQTGSGNNQSVSLATAVDGDESAADQRIFP